MGSQGWWEQWTVALKEAGDDVHTNEHQWPAKR